MYACVYIYVHIWTVCMHVYIYIHIWTACVYICMYVYVLNMFYCSLLTTPGMHHQGRKKRMYWNAQTACRLELCHGFLLLVAPTNPKKRGQMGPFKAVRWKNHFEIWHYQAVFKDWNIETTWVCLKLVVSRPLCGFWNKKKQWSITGWNGVPYFQTNPSSDSLLPVIGQNDSLLYNTGVIILQYGCAIQLGTMAHTHKHM